MINIKNKKLEISIHLLIWLVLFFLPAAFSLGSDGNWLELFKHFWMQLIFLAVIFYINYFFLINWLYTDKKFHFIAFNVVLIIVLIILKQQIFQLIDTPRPRGGGGRRPPDGFIYFMDFMTYLIPVAFSIAINSGQRMKQAEEMKREADNIKLKSELQHLKYQLQPHFFFNALNNIYSLIDFAPDKAKHSIHSLSKLMRHLLYKTDVEKITLSEEIDFLNKYIELMTLRLNDNTKVYTSFPPKIPNVEIAPLLFISVVENAFKHGVSATQHSDISFKMEINEDEEILFMASNSNFPKTDTDKSGSGIGVENLKKRLNLLYPEKYEFHSHLNNGMYIAEMKLKIK
ncbi:histidine kinase [Chryseobacterium sp. MYb264]|uniref:sensor histidine kinase n=1 Tax=Chryseobacterium sp. MYb264 TaxID=2745153 RepID=UPI002E12DD08|nr:histidine kinase [Chryseobacterium sp. MYb264]